MSLPVSTVDVERGFSQQNLIKSRTTTRLLPDKLGMLMKIHVATEGPLSECMDTKLCVKMALFSKTWTKCHHIVLCQRLSISLFVGL